MITSGYVHVPGYAFVRALPRRVEGNTATLHFRVELQHGADATLLREAIKDVDGIDHGEVRLPCQGRVCNLQFPVSIAGTTKRTRGEFLSRTEGNTLQAIADNVPLLMAAPTINAPQRNTKSGANKATGSTAADFSG